MYLWLLPELRGGGSAGAIDAGVLSAGLPALVDSEDIGSIFPYFTGGMEA